MTFFFFLFLLINISKYNSHVHVKLEVICDDNCISIFLDEELVYENTNPQLDLNPNYIYTDFLAERGQNIKFKIYNKGGNGGLGAKILISNQNGFYQYLTTTNEDMFIFNLTEPKKHFSVQNSYKNKQTETWQNLYTILGNILTTFYEHPNQFIEVDFTIPEDIEDEISFSYEEYYRVIVHNADHMINLNDFIHPFSDISYTYNKIYFFKDDIDLNGNFYFQDSNNEINYNEIYNYNGDIYYIPKNQIYYIDKIYYTLSHGEFLDLYQYGTIYLKICPDYCQECTIYRVCQSIYPESNIEDFISQNVELYYNQVLYTNERTSKVLITSTNNFQRIENSLKPNLGYCENVLKDYFHTEDFIITTYYSSNEINKVIIFNEDLEKILTLTDLSICLNSKIFYDETSLQMKNCYETCKTCFGNQINNCKSCNDRNILTTKNTCVNIYEKCGNGKNLRLFEAYDDGSIECIHHSNCNSNNKNFLKDTLECVNSCDSISISYLACISCAEYESQIFNSCVDLKDKIKSVQIIQENIIKFLDSDPLFVSGNYIYYIDTYPPTNTIVNVQLSDINLGECEYLLKDKYNISKKEKLIIFQIETIVEGKPTSNLEYYVYSNDGNLLDLGVCDGTEISITKTIINDSSIDYDYANSFAEKGIDVYNIKDEFFTDFCNGVSVNNQDLTLQNRIDDVYVNISFCDDGCEYQGIDLETKKVICSCTNIKETNDNKKESNKFNRKFKEVSKKLLDNINYKIFVCYKYWFEPKKLRKNSGFLFLISLFFISQVFFFFFWVNWYEVTLKKVRKALKLKKKDTKSVNLETQKNLLFSQNTNSNNENDDNNINIPPKKINNIIIKKTEMNKEKKESEFFSIRSSNSPKKRKRDEPFYNYFFYSPMKVKFKKGDSTKTINSLNTEYPLSSKKINVKIYDKKNDKKKEIDYDALNYYQALKKDQRKFLNIFKHTVTLKIDILSITLHIGQFEYFPILISTYILSISIDFIINALLFCDEVISSKYKNGGELKFWESWILSVCSNIISKLFAIIILQFTEYNIKLEIITREVKNKNKTKIKLYNYSLDVIHKIRKKIYIYFLLQNILMLLFTYYLTIFCALYSESQSALFKNYFIGSFNSLLYSIIISFIITILRIISIVYHKKRWFLISLFFQIKL